MTQTIRIIVAADPTGLIGIRVPHTRDDGHVISKDKMPWHFRQDLKRFKRTTMGGTLIMGRTTWESLPGKLPGRDHIVLSRDTFYETEESDVIAATSLEQALQFCQVNSDIWISGGTQIYRLALDAGCVDEIDFTLVPEATLPEKVDRKIYWPGDKDLEEDFDLVSEERNPKDDRLLHRRYKATYDRYSQ